MKKILALWLLLLSVPAFAQTLKVNLLSLTGADARDEDRIHRALDIISEVVNSETFRAEILKSKFTQTNLTSKQVLDKILEGTENFSGGQKNAIDLFLDMYEERSSTVGYTSPNDKYLHMNRYFQGKYTPEETAGNIFHEWLHKIGFNHSKYNNSQRPNSVPYKLGYLLAGFTGTNHFVKCQHE
jgi:hypothetical protein